LESGEAGRSEFEMRFGMDNTMNGTNELCHLHFPSCGKYRLVSSRLLFCSNACPHSRPQHTPAARQSQSNRLSPRQHQQSAVHLWLRVLYVIYPRVDWHSPTHSLTHSPVSMSSGQGPAASHRSASLLSHQHSCFCAARARARAELSTTALHCTALQVAPPVVSPHPQPCQPSM